MLSSLKRQLIFYILFALSTLLTLFILYRDMTHTIAHIYVIAYAAMLIIFLIYALLSFIIRLAKLEATEIRIRLQKFTIYFILFMIINLTLDFFIHSANSSVTNSLPIAFGLATGISFFDLLFKQA